MAETRDADDEPSQKLADVFPRLVASIVRLLGDDSRAATIGDLPYYGTCACDPSCDQLSTAPPGAGWPRVVQLEEAPSGLTPMATTGSPRRG